MKCIAVIMIVHRRLNFSRLLLTLIKAPKKNLCYFDLVNLKKFSISFIILGLGKSQGLKPQTLSQAKSRENLLTCSSLPLSLSLSLKTYIYSPTLSQYIYIYIYIVCVCVCVLFIFPCLSSLTICFVTMRSDCNEVLP